MTPRVLRAVGVAVPVIEAWLLCGRESAMTESAGLAGQESGVPTYSRRDLKWRVYGTDRPPLPLEIKRAVVEVMRHRGDLRWTGPVCASRAHELARRAAGRAGPFSRSHWLAGASMNF